MLNSKDRRGLSTPRRHQTCGLPHAQGIGRLGLTEGDLRDLAAPEHLNSVGGLIVHQLQRLPEEGEQLEIDGHQFTIKRMAGHRIQAVTVRMAQAEDAGAA